MKGKINIRYCTKCRWLLRSAWIAQELLTTFQEELEEVSLSPDTGGIFEITVNGNVVWTFKEKRRFPELKELKQIVRNIIAPEKSLGHSDAANPPEGESCPL